jgi:hypothetical protein
VTEDLLDRGSSAQHLAMLAHKEPQQDSAGSTGHGKHRHHNLSKAPHKPPHGSGHKATGYSKQC